MERVAATFMHEYSTNRGFIGGAWEAVTEISMQTVREQGTRE